MAVNGIEIEARNKDLPCWLQEYFLWSIKEYFGNVLIKIEVLLYRLCLSAPSLMTFCLPLLLSFLELFSYNRQTLLAYYFFAIFRRASARRLPLSRVSRAPRLFRANRLPQEP